MPGAVGAIGAQGAALYYRARSVVRRPTAVSGSGRSCVHVIKARPLRWHCRRDGASVAVGRARGGLPVRRTWLPRGGQRPERGRAYGVGAHPGRSGAGGDRGRRHRVPGGERPAPMRRSSCRVLSAEDRRPCQSEQVGDPSLPVAAPADVWTEDAHVRVERLEPVPGADTRGLPPARTDTRPSFDTCTWRGALTSDLRVGGSITVGHRFERR